MFLVGADRRILNQAHHLMMVSLLAHALSKFFRIDRFVCLFAIIFAFTPELTGREPMCQ